MSHPLFRLRWSTVALLSGSVLLSSCGSPNTSTVPQAQTAISDTSRKATDVEINKALEALQGSWSVTRRVKEGEDKEVKGLVAIIEKDQMTLKKPGFDDVSKISVDPSQKPARIDMIPKTLSVQVEGIYQLTGDDLKIHLALAGSGGTVPNDFEPKPSTELLIMKRISKEVLSRQTTTKLTKLDLPLGKVFESPVTIEVPEGAKAEDLLIEVDVKAKPPFLLEIRPKERELAEEVRRNLRKDREVTHLIDTPDTKFIETKIFGEKAWLFWTEVKVGDTYYQVRGGLQPATREEVEFQLKCAKTLSAKK